jgi:hypothetical protein
LISGNYAVVGAYYDDDKGGDSGSAYIFGYNATSNSWGQVAKLTAYDGASNDFYGYSVAISGTTVAIGSYRDGDKGDKSGSVYVYQYNQGSNIWGLVAKLTASDGAAGDWFGYTVSVSGTTIAVGAPPKSAAYLFEYNGGTNSWGQVAKLTASGGGGDWFGWATSIDGNTAVIGAPGENSGCGSAYIFKRVSNSWVQAARLTASDAAGGDWFAEVVSVSGNTVVMGASYDDDYGTSSGSAYVFQFNEASNSWGQVAKLIASDSFANDRFGNSVAISGTTAIVGAFYDDDKGALHMFFSITQHQMVGDKLQK